MKLHILKAEVSPKTKILLSEMAKKEKRSLKKQVEFIIEKEVQLVEHLKVINEEDN